MIDTLKVKIPLTPLNLVAMQNKYTQSVVSNTGNGVKYYAPLVIPPLNEELMLIKGFDRIGKMNMFFYVEGSLPRVVFGDNVRLLDIAGLPSLFKRIESALVEQYSDVPSWETWEIMRADFVYPFTFTTGTELHEMLEYIKTQIYKDKKKLDFGETITFGGRSFSASFYMKEIEFRKNGYKKLVAKGLIEQADRILELSKNMLRYEVRLHRAKLVSLTKKKEFYLKDLYAFPEEWYYKVLNDCLYELLRNNNNFFEADNDAVTKLLSKYQKSKALRLFCFWRTYYIQDEYIKKLLRKVYNSSTLLRNFKDIENAGVGIPKISNNLVSKLSIPNASAHVALATEQEE